MTKCWNAAKTQMLPMCYGECVSVQDKGTSQYSFVCACLAWQTGEDCSIEGNLDNPPKEQTWTVLSGGNKLDPSLYKPGLKESEIGVYVAENAKGCMDICSNLNNAQNIRYHHECGSMAFQSGGSRGKGVCHLYRYKPVGSCSSWLVPAAGSEVAMITPIIPNPNPYGLCH